MREMTLPDAGPKRKLFDAAEQLFADQGFEAVSVRDITQLAKANVASVNYHFGSREGLMTLVMTRYMVPVTEERISRLDAAEKRYAGKVVPLEELIEAFVRPLADQVRKSDLAEKLFYKLMGRMFSQQCDGLPQFLEEQIRHTFDRYSKAFSKTLPGLGTEDLVWRIHFMAGGMIHMMTHQEVIHRISSGASGNPSMETTLARFVRYAAAGMREGLDLDAPAKKTPQATFDF